MILDLTAFSIYIKPGKTDMRKQANGLSVIAEEEMALDLRAKSIFLFCSKDRKLIKCLYWDRNGFCLWQLCKASHNCHYVKKDIMRRKMKNQAETPGISGSYEKSLRIILVTF